MPTAWFSHINKTPVEIYTTPNLSSSSHLFTIHQTPVLMLISQIYSNAHSFPDPINRGLRVLKVCFIENERVK